MMSRKASGKQDHLLLVDDSTCLCMSLFTSWATSPKVINDKIQQINIILVNFVTLLSYRALLHKSSRMYTFVSSLLYFFF